MMTIDLEAISMLQPIDVDVQGSISELLETLGENSAPVLLRDKDTGSLYLLVGCEECIFIGPQAKMENILSILQDI